MLLYLVCLWENNARTREISNFPLNPHIDSLLEITGNFMVFVNCKGPPGSAGQHGEKGEKGDPGRVRIRGKHMFHH